MLGLRIEPGDLVGASATIGRAVKRPEQGAMAEACGRIERTLRPACDVGGAFERRSGGRGFAATWFFV